MKNFDVEEQVTEDGAKLIVKAINGLRFQDGSTTKEIILRSDYGPRIGERIICGGLLVKVADKRYSESGSLWVLDEDTRAWFEWGKR